MGKGPKQTLLKRRYANVQSQCIKIAQRQKSSGKCNLDHSEISVHTWMNSFYQKDER
jgi:hypothetical protein